LIADSIQMENSMWRVAIGVVLGMAAIAVAAAAAEDSKQAPPPKCLKAEINPVTGHVLCIDPLGAPVEPLPLEAASPCKTEDTRGQWSYGPACAPELGGM
jgi:hypothetical protein